MRHRYRQGTQTGQSRTPPTCRCSAVSAIRRPKGSNSSGTQSKPQHRVREDRRERWPRSCAARQAPNRGLMLGAGRVARSSARQGQCLLWDAGVRGACGVNPCNKLH